MKSIGEMIQLEVAAFIQTRLSEQGIRVILSGGTAVSYYSSNRYVSKDIDLVNDGMEVRRKIKNAMKQLGFSEIGRHFKHPKSIYIIEFPSGPLAVGGEKVIKVNEIELETGKLRIISPTDSVKDRLSGYYHWGDRQTLQQAVLVARSQEVDLGEIRRWSMVEGKLEEFTVFQKELITGRWQPD